MAKVEKAIQGAANKTDEVIQKGLNKAKAKAKEYAEEAKAFLNDKAGGIKNAAQEAAKYLPLFLPSVPLVSPSTEALPHCPFLVSSSLWLPLQRR